MVKIEKPAILIGLPRSGTSWVFKYIRLYYEKHGILLPKTRGINVFEHDEWFDNEDYHDQDKIQLLEACRKCGIEVGYKMLVNALHPIDYYPHKSRWKWKKYGESVNILDWFKEFYKDTDIIILKRKNLWRTYISYLFHHRRTIQLRKNNEVVWNDPDNLWHSDITLINKTIEKYKIEFKHDENLWNKFIDDVRLLNNDVINKLPNAEVYWTEELTDEFLTRRFGGTPKNKIKIQNIDYESYWSKKGLRYMKEKYNKVFQDEFKEYGYTE